MEARGLSWHLPLALTGTMTTLLGNISARDHRYILPYCAIFMGKYLWHIGIIRINSVTSRLNNIMAAPYVEPFLSWQFAPYLLPYFPQKYEKNE